MMLLPPELILAVLTTLSHSNDLKTLKSCSLVCKAWSTHAQPLLLHSLHLRAHHSKQFITLTKASAMQASTSGASTNINALSSSVRTLDISIGTHCRDDVLHLAHFTRILACCRKLQDLTLRVYGIHELSSQTIRELQCIELKDLRRFALMASDAGSVVLTQLLDLWPSVDRVVVGIGAIATAKGWKNKCRLRSISFLQTPTLENMESLLANSSRTLEALDFRDKVSAQFLTAILSSYGPRLRSLRLRDYASVSTVVVRYCRSLQEIDFHHSVSVSTAYIIPRSVQKLVYRTPTHNTCVNLLPIINTLTSCPDIETFGCNQSLAEHPHYATLMHICSRRDIIVEQITPVDTENPPNNT